MPVYDRYVYGISSCSKLHLIDFAKKAAQVCLVSRKSFGLARCQKFTTPGDANKSIWKITTERLPFLIYQVNITTIDNII